MPAGGPGPTRDYWTSSTGNSNSPTRDGTLSRAGVFSCGESLSLRSLRLPGTDVTPDSVFTVRVDLNRDSDCRRPAGVRPGPATRSLSYKGSGGWLDLEQVGGRRSAQWTRNLIELENIVIAIFKF